MILATTHRYFNRKTGQSEAPDNVYVIIKHFLCCRNLCCRAGEECSVHSRCDEANFQGRTLNQASRNCNDMIPS